MAGIGAGIFADAANRVQKILIGVAGELLGDGALADFRVPEPAEVVGDPVVGLRLAPWPRAGTGLAASEDEECIGVGSGGANAGFNVADVAGDFVPLKRQQNPVGFVEGMGGIGADGMSGDNDGIGGRHLCRE